MKSACLPAILITVFVLASPGMCETKGSFDGVRVTDGPDFLARPNHFTLDGSLFSVTLGYARSVGGNSYVGVEAGLGWEWVTYNPVLGDSHLDTFYFHELLHAALLWRYQPSEYWQTDVGIRSSLSINYWADGPVLFLGGYAAFYVGWRYIKFGPRVLVGVSETGGELPSGSAVGVIMPLTVRFLLPW